MDHSLLNTELTTDPLDLGYSAHIASGNDQALADLLNTKQFRGPVPIVEVSSYCVVNGIIGACEIAAYDPAVPAQIRGVCITVTTLLRDDFRLTTCDVDDPAFGMACDALLAAGIISAQQKTHMMLLAENRVSRAEGLFGESVHVTNSDISFALRGQR
jgi:hypothetical protein